MLASRIKVYSTQEIFNLDRQSLVDKSFIVGTGVDLVSIDRLRSSLEKFGDKFKSRVFTPEEIEYCTDRRNEAVHFSGRFAAKEAVMKVLGTGWSSGIVWKDISIVREESQPPTVQLSGEAARVADNRNIGNVHISITHTDTLAIAFAIGETSRRPV